MTVDFAAVTDFVVSYFVGWIVVTAETGLVVGTGCFVEIVLGFSISGYSGSDYDFDVVDMADFVGMEPDMVDLYSGFGFHYLLVVVHTPVIRIVDCLVSF